MILILYENHSHMQTIFVGPLQSGFCIDHKQQYWDTALRNRYGKKAPLLLPRIQSTITGAVPMESQDLRNASLKVTAPRLKMLEFLEKVQAGT